MDSTALQLVMTPEEELAQCEAVIAASKRTFYEVGCAVRRIREKRLYRMRDGGIYKSFHAYCKGVWKWTRRYADYLIEAAAVVENLRTMVLKTDPTERLVRPLTKLVEPDEQIECFLEAQKQADAEGKEVAGRHVAAVVRDHIGEEQSWLIKPSDNWNFSPVFYGRLDGEKGYGYIPGEVYANCLFYYTRAGDCVVDPMAGSGQIFRVYEDRARWMRPEPWGLDVHGFDLTPRGPYADRIGQHDLCLGFPTDHADYIFIDIPYFGMVKDQYSSRSDDLANMDINTWKTSILAIAQACSDAQEATKLCTIFSPNYRDIITREIIITTRIIQSAFEMYGYMIHDIAYSSRRIQQAQTPDMARTNNTAREHHIMLTDMAEVLTFRKV
jgi:hypothetical protein